MRGEQPTFYVASHEPSLFHVLRQEPVDPEALRTALGSASLVEHLGIISREIGRPGFRDVELADAALDAVEAEVRRLKEIQATTSSSRA